MKREQKPIDKVTVKNLDMVLKTCDIQLSKNLLDKIIDIVELIEERGDQVTIESICELQDEWEQLKELKS